MSAGGGDAFATLGEATPFVGGIVLALAAVLVLLVLALDAGPHAWWVVNAQQLVRASLASALLVSGAVALYRERRRG